MNCLVINTAGVVEMAALHDGKSEYRTLGKVMAAELLLPTVDEMLDKMNLKLGDFDSFVCAVGPGSFTGIRMGVVAVRSFAYALGKSAYGVTYNRILAYNTNERVATFTDGGGSACYVAVYEGENTVMEPICIYKKDCQKYFEDVNIADFPLDGAKLYEPNADALLRAAEYAVKNELEPLPVYIRKPQPERKGSDI